MRPGWMIPFASLLALLPACGGAGAMLYGAAPDSTMEPAAAAPQAIATGGIAGPSIDVAGAHREVRAEPAPAPEEMGQERYAQAETSGDEPPTATDGRSGRLLVYRAELALAVHQVQDKLARIEALATEAGGHLSQRSGDSIQVRVPAAQFQPVLAAILELGDVLRRDVTVDDVSEEFHDVQLRIRTLEAMYQRVSQMLEDADNVEQALAVQQHLERITMELERLRGRLRFLSDQVAFSTIAVSFTERTEASEPEFELPFPWLRALGLNRLLGLR